MPIDQFYCVRCKQPILPEDPFCPKCGQAQDRNTATTQHQGQMVAYQHPAQYAPPQPPQYAPPQPPPYYLPPPQYPQYQYPPQGQMMQQQPQQQQQQQPVIVVQPSATAQQSGGGFWKSILTGAGIVGGVGIGCIGFFFIMLVFGAMMCAPR